MGWLRVILSVASDVLWGARNCWIQYFPHDNQGMNDMIKKILAATAVAGALLFAGASAANAANYSPDVTATTGSSTLEVGGTTTITAVFANTQASSATFAVSPSTGASLSALVRTAAAVEKPIVNGAATANFEATAPGTYTVTVTAGEATDTVSITVAAAGSGAADGSGSGTLPSTGGQVPAAALWAGAGALGLGTLAVVAATARRRAQR